MRAVENCGETWRSVKRKYKVSTVATDVIHSWSYDIKQKNVKKY